jgi:hypothetical protein
VKFFVEELRATASAMRARRAHNEHMARMADELGLMGC